MSTENQKGLFIALEGPQWVGKTTLGEHLVYQYGKHRVKFFKLFEPNFTLTVDPGDPIHSLRNVIERLYGKRIPNPLAQISAAHTLRELLWQGHIAPALDDGYIVVVENWHLKTFVDQVAIAGGFQDAPIGFLNATLGAHDFRCSVPDLILNLSAQPAQLLDRRRSTGLPDLSEAEYTSEISHLTQVVMAYAQTCTQEINRLISAEGPAGNVAAMAVEVINAELA